MTNQELAFKKLSRLKVGALFMEMGTGKTKVALDLIASKMHKVDYVLWICPCSLKAEIEAERVKWHVIAKMVKETGKTEDAIIREALKHHCSMFPAYIVMTSTDASEIIDTLR